MVAIINTTEIWVPMAGLVDNKAEIARINKELDKLNKQLAVVNNKLINKDYLHNAPGEIVAKEQEKQVVLQGAINKLQDNLAKINNF